jgi:hypothetical protein
MDVKDPRSGRNRLVWVFLKPALAIVDATRAHELFGVSILNQESKDGLISIQNYVVK